MEQRTFPIRVWPIEGEALSGWLDRYCSALSTSRIDLYRSIGLRPLASAGQSRDHSLPVSDETAQCIGLATGVPAHKVHQLTMARYEGRVLVFREQRMGIDVHFLWARGAGTRYCPLCLREAPGVWPLAWRLSWSFACVRHGALLLDECLGCGLVPWSRVRLGDVPMANLCPNGIKGSGGHSTSCLVDLSQAPVVRFPGGAPIVEAQAWLLSAINSTGTPSPSLQRLLNDLKMLAGRALRVVTADECRRWNRTDHVSSSDFDVDTSIRRTGQSPPHSALTMAHAVSLAAMVLRSDDESVYVPLIRRLLSDRMGRVVTEAPSSRIRRWGEPSPALTGKMLIALHEDLRPGSALRYRTAGPSPAPPSKDGTRILARARSVPQLFWPGRVHLMGLDDFVGPRTLQRALSVGVLVPDYDRAELALQREVLGLHRADDSFSYVFRRLPSSIGYGLMQVLLRLASYFDALPAPIDYERRRRLRTEALLPLAIWKGISSNDVMSGSAPVAAHLYLVYQLTGSIAKRTENGGSGYFVVQNFIASTPPEILDLLDIRAEAFLAEAGIAEPLKWEPPAHLFENMHANGVATKVPDPLVRSLIGRGLLEPRLLRQVENRTVKAATALRPGNDSFQVRLRRLLGRGESIDDMAVQLNRSPRMIRQHIARLGVPPKADQKIQLGLDEVRDMYLAQHQTTNEIARVTGWDKKTILRLLRRAGVILRDPGGGSSGLSGVEVAMNPDFPPLLKKAMRGPRSTTRLQRFSAASSCLTWAEAARELKLCQPALVNQMKALERDVEGRLFNRGPGKRSIELTERGVVLLGLVREYGLVR
jgi:hypothetical protein